MSETTAKDGHYLPASDAFANWFAGFTDGEGCFMAKARKAGTWDLCFAFTMRADEQPVLEEIQKHYGGYIYTYHKGINHAVSLRWSSAADCLRIQQLFTKYPLRAKKKHCFKLWSALLGAKVIGIKTSDVAELIKELKAIKLYQGAQDVSTVPAVSDETSSLL